MSLSSECGTGTGTHRHHHRFHVEESDLIALLRPEGLVQPVRRRAARAKDRGAEQRSVRATTRTAADAAGVYGDSEVDGGEDCG
jgi:hypothetical protein